MIFFKTQNNFGRGQIDPRLQSRVQEPIWQKGLLNAENCLIEPSGVVKKRYGQEFINDLTANGIKFKLIPFEYSLQFVYLLVFYPGNVGIYYNDQLVATIATLYGSDEISSLRYAQSADIMILTDGIHIPQQLTRVTHPGTWSIGDVTFSTVPTYDFNKNYYNINFTSSATYGAVTITASSPIFFAGLVNGLFIANGCVARITAFTDTTHITAQTLGESFFFTNDLTPGGTIAPISGLNTVIKEPAWSALRGWPTNPCLHANRLWFGGSTQRPQNIWGSVVGDYYNFDEGTGLPDQCVNVNIDTQQLNSIEYLVSANTLEVFTNTGVYVAATPDNTDALTPGLTITLQSKEGSSAAPPVFIDNQVFYAQRGGKIIRNFLYDFDIRAYDSNNISIYSSDLARNPIDTCVQKYSDSVSANYIYFVNADGTITTYQTEKSEDVSGFTLVYSDEDAYYLNACALNNDVYFIVKRLINGVNKYYLEKISLDTCIDCFVEKNYVSPTQVITGLDYLEGKTVEVLRDGIIDNVKTVVSGQITADAPGSVFQIGLKISSLITPLPLANDYFVGPTTYLLKTVRNLFIELYDTIGMRVDGNLLAYFQLNNYILGSIQPGVSTIYTYPYLKDWELRQNISITHDYPTSFTLCGLGYEMVLELPQ